MHSTADIYKALGGKKSKDIRTQLDGLYKQGLVARSKISNSYFWTLKNEEDDEILDDKKGASENVLSSSFYKMLVKQLREEIFFLRGTVTGLIKHQKTDFNNASTIQNTESPSPISPTITQKNTTCKAPSDYTIFPTETPVIYTNAASFQPPNHPPPTQIQHASVISTTTSIPAFETPKHTAPPRIPASVSIPLRNRFEQLAINIHDSLPVTTSNPTQLSNSSIPPQTTQVAQPSQPRHGTNTIPNHHGPHVNNYPEHDSLAIKLDNMRNNTRSTATTKIGLLGDSNFNRIMVPEINNILKNGRAAKYSYSGATSIHLHHYSDILLKEKPDSVIIHAGTNDIWGKNKRNASSQQIALDIISVGTKCKSNGVKSVYISSILKTRIPASNIIGKEVNNLLKLLCFNNELIYIDNSFLSESDLDDQVHLSWDGRRKLVNNYINILKR